MTSKSEKNSAVDKPKQIAPDGGYGWFIVISYGIANVLIVPVITSFGLIFKDKFHSLNLSALDAALILNLNSALGMTLGLFNGALLNCFGYRKIALLGGTLFSGGLIFTSWANSFWHFIISYSIITSIGMGLCSSSFSLAMNTYFKEKRNRAFGIGATITGLGPILFPQLITVLIGFYGSQGTTLIVGGIAMNILAAALLLRPVKWHQKPLDKLAEAEKDSLYKPSFSGTSSQTRTNSYDTISEDEEEYLETCPIYHDVDSQSIYGFDNHPLQKSNEILWNDLNYKFQPPKPTKTEKTDAFPAHIPQRSGSVDYSAVNDFEKTLPRKKRWFESDSIASINLESSLKIFHEDERQTSMSRISSRHKMFDGGFRKGMRRNTVGVILESPKELPNQPRKKKILCKGLRNGWSRFVKIFDLGLLNDKIYLNMMIGIAIAVFAEINFSLLTPFILNEFEYDTKQIAVFMSTLAIVDIFCRFISPFIGDYFKQPPRVMYMLSLLMLIIFRSALLFASSSYRGILLVALGLGVAKGVRSVYMQLVVPNYIPLDRLAAASGIQMVTNGVILLTFGSFIGLFRDFFGNYSACIIFINLITCTTLVLWTVEMIYMKRKHAKNKKEEQKSEILELCKFKIDVN